MAAKERDGRGVARGPSGAGQGDGVPPEEMERRILAAVEDRELLRLLLIDFAYERALRRAREAD